MKSVIILVLVMIQGCASDTELQMGYNAQVSIVQAQVGIQNKDTFIIDCSGRGGCGSAVIHYLDPRDRSRVVVPRIANSNDTVIGIAPNIVTGIGILGAAWAATDIFGAFADSAGSGNSSTTINGNNNSLSESSSKSGNSHEFSDSSSIDSNSSTNSTSNVDSNDYTTTDRHDAVSKPTVVNQPDPVIVNQPDPVIVSTTVVNPVIVDPVIVDPVIVQP